ncbi:hypothetical protein AAA799E16_01148 [Marine Group I thaumarchaeote SCGC AAA799-E16]|uniref:DUF3426 domain-containing protein n=3 Tax=Marine Group I TaxID=905826 RepID=A0A087RQX0_9ARCH|nr:hypothetical protein AAA799E16_01148 [Marine Group I thaumarchaeote SCGC AAA799-E16]KFM15874.1 hypothetical protein AAA799D11_01032 [Marine Group I thaumarchaeote SCGC AAA799-D11]KFM17439.1 hypothetical protein SCCGRSA3_01907 [Marine Group I thaumarchaeote SCGC RSA3]
MENRAPSIKNSQTHKNYFKEPNGKIIVEKIFIMGIIFASMTPLVFADVYIQNDQQYVGDDGSVHIVGEIVNNLDIPLNQINVEIDLFDENQQLIQTQKTNSLVNTIMPGMKGPFDLILTDNEAKNAKSYSLLLNYQASPPKSQVIDITESSLTRDNHNNLMITGTVVNNGEITANTISVIATLYDKQGNVAAVSKANPKPDYLGSEDSAFFVLSVPDKIQTEGIDEYTLIAESEEYAAVPEFPVGTVILLILTLSAYIGITRYSGRIITNLFSATNLK